MPTATDIIRKSWCREHQTDYEGEFCFASFDWGPTRPDDGSLNGAVWASQQVAAFGASEVDAAPIVVVELGARSVELKVEDLLSLRKRSTNCLEPSASRPSHESHVPEG